MPGGISTAALGGGGKNGAQLPVGVSCQLAGARRRRQRFAERRAVLSHKASLQRSLRRTDMRLQPKLSERALNVLEEIAFLAMSNHVRCSKRPRSVTK